MVGKTICPSQTYFVTNQLELQNDKYKLINVEYSLEILDGLSVLSLDTETTGLDCHTDDILLLQLGNEEIQVVIDCTTIDIKLYKELIENRKLILQNAKFDLKFLYKYNIIPKKTIWDTMLSEQVLYAGLNPEVNLQALANKYCKVKLSKDIRDKIGKLGVTPEVVLYGANDIKVLPEIQEKQLYLAKRRNVLKAIKLENSFVKTLAYVEYSGIYLNTEKWTDKYKSAQKNLAETINRLDKYVIDNNLTKYIDKQLDLFNPNLSTSINWASAKQVLPLFKDLGINVFSPDNKSGESISEKIISKQKDEFEIIPIYLEYKGVSKDFTTYGESFLDNINSKTGRIHSNFNQIMITSRLSSSGPNLQNLPRDARTRNCFTPQHEDNILVVADYDSQEDRIFVNRSKEKKMIEFYSMDNADGHSYVASLCFPKEIGNTPLEEISEKFTDLRQIAKSAKFAIHYSGTGFTISKNLNLSEEEGERIYNAYTTTFPDIAAYLKNMMAKAKKLGYITTSTGTNRKVWCPNFHKLVENNDYMKIYEFSKLAANYPIQTEGAEITKIAGIYFFEWILENDLFNIVKISNLVHDEIMIECPKYMKEEVALTIKKCMEDAGNLYCKIIPITATPEITNVWKH